MALNGKHAGKWKWQHLVDDYVHQALLRVSSLHGKSQVQMLIELVLTRDEFCQEKMLADDPVNLERYCNNDLGHKSALEIHRQYKARQAKAVDICAQLEQPVEGTA